MIDLESARIRATFGSVNSIIHSTALVRREVYDEIGGYRERWRSVDDYEFFARALLAGFELLNLPAVMHRIRQHPGSISSVRTAETNLKSAGVGARYDLSRAGKRGGLVWIGALLRYGRRVFRAQWRYRRTSAAR